MKYAYDSLYRIQSATTVGDTSYPQWGLSWTYDAYGNRLTQNISAGCTGITCPINSLSVSAATNQITGTGFGYDSSGNMTHDGVNTLTYDAENRAVTSSGTYGTGTYIYDGNNRRVQKCISTCGSPTSSTVYIFSGGMPIAEYDNGAAVGSPTREFIYSDSKLLAVISVGATNYVLTDHLSPRAVVSSSGTVVGQQGHFPYGELWYAASTTTKYQFTDYERDSESENDYAKARLYVNRLGRFASPDPIEGDPADPQSLDRYSYVRDSPIDSIDPSGMKTCSSAINHLREAIQRGVASGPSDEAGALGLLEESILDNCGCTVSADGLTVTCPYDTVPTSDTPFTSLLSMLEYPPNYGGPNEPGGSKSQTQNQPKKSYWQCVSDGANDVSLAALLPKGTPKLFTNLASNDFSSLQNLVVGPDRVDAATSVAEGKGANVIGQVVGAITTGADHFVLRENGAGTTYALDLVEETVADTTLGTIASLASGAKLAYDAGTYLAGLATCSIWGK